MDPAQTKLMSDRRGQRFPVTALEDLSRTEGGLVSHFPAAGDVIAQIEVKASASLGQIDQRQD